MHAPLAEDRQRLIRAWREHLTRTDQFLAEVKDDGPDQDCPLCLQQLPKQEER